MSVLSTCIEAYINKKKIVFFGAGQYSALRHVHRVISYFCDNAPGKQGSTFYGIPVYHPSRLLDEKKDKTIIIINTEHFEEVAAQLLEMGFYNIYSDMYKCANEPITRAAADSKNFLHRKAEAILRNDVEQVRDLFADDISKRLFDNLIKKYETGNFDFSDLYCTSRIYFNNIFRSELKSGEIYIDAGAFDGTTIMDFILFTKGNYKKIYAFEPDPLNFHVLYNEFYDCRDTVIEQLALSNTDGNVSFDARGTQSSRIIKDNEQQESGNAKTIKIDTYMTEPVSFIKMDIEGGEYKALLGAQKIITKHKPKLAISVYHCDDDLVRLPILIKEMVAEYKLYLRHHTISSVDTVLYVKC